MEIIISIITFSTILFISIEIVFSFVIFLTINNFKYITQQIFNHISDINFHRSTGKEIPQTSLNYISANNTKFVPDFFKNDIPLKLAANLKDYLLQESISSRETSTNITNKLLKEEHWFLSLKYEDLITSMNFLRSLYIPMGALCSIIIFIAGYSQISLGSDAPSFEIISKNIFIISITIKNAGITLALGIFSYILSNSFYFFIGKKKIKSDLSEAIFQLKASPVKIKND